jgi:hypothetical protein
MVHAMFSFLSQIFHLYGSISDQATNSTFSFLQNFGNSACMSCMCNNFLTGLDYMRVAWGVPSVITLFYLLWGVATPVFPWLLRAYKGSSDNGQTSCKWPRHKLMSQCTQWIHNKYGGKYLLCFCAAFVIYYLNDLFVDNVDWLWVPLQVLRTKCIWFCHPRTSHSIW